MSKTLTLTDSQVSVVLQALWRSMLEGNTDGSPLSDYITLLTQQVIVKLENDNGLWKDHKNVNIIYNKK